MKRSLICSVAIVIASLSYAGGAGLIIKGAFRSWDEIAKMALKVSGRELTDDAVRSAAKTIEHAAGEYGDDVAKASVRGGVEVAEQTMKRGGRFFGILQRTVQHSDESVRALALNADDMVKYSAKYGDDVVVKLNAKVPGQVSRMVSAAEKSGIGGVEGTVRSVSNLPADDISRVLGAVEKNPSVARNFLEHVEKGGKYFVDKIFALNAKQIMAGGLTTAMIVGASGVVDPFKKTGEAIERQSKRADDFFRNKATPDQQHTEATGTSETTNATKKRITDALSRAVEHIGEASAIGVVVAIVGIFGFLTYWVYKRVHLINVRQKAASMSAKEQGLPIGSGTAMKDAENRSVEENAKSESAHQSEASLHRQCPE